MKHSFTLQIHRAGIMQSRWLPRIIQTRTQISRELRITSSFGWNAYEDNDGKDDCSQNCIYIMCKTDIFFPGASGRDSAGQFGHKSSSSNWGRGGSTKHPFVPGEAFLVLTYLFVLLVKTVSCLRRIILSVILNYCWSKLSSLSQGTFGSVHTGNVRCCQYLGKGEEETRLVAVCSTTYA